jgi:acyl carrier protein
MTATFGMAEDLLTVFQEEVADVVGIEPTAVTTSTDLVREYDVDSLELMEIAARLESRLAVRLDPHRLTEQTTVQDVLAYLADALGGDR